MLSRRVLLIFALYVRCVVSFIHWGQSDTHVRIHQRLAATKSSWQSHVSTHPDAVSALNKVLNEISDSEPQDVAFLFVGQAHADSFDGLVKSASSHFGPSTHLIALVGGGVIGEGREIDIPSASCLSLMTGRLPEGACIEVKNPKEDDLDDDGDYLLFVDPWSDIQSIIEDLESKCVIAGGISCPVSQTMPTIAYMNQVLPSGSALAIKLSGTIGLQTVVAQGCRPIGKESLVISEIQRGQIVTKLDGKPALEVLREVTHNASPEDHKLIETGLLCGVASSEGDGDYLSRQIAGFVPSINGLVVAAPNLKEGDRFCFQVRDAAIAEQDLKWMVDRAKTARLVNGDFQPIAALQISCVARGRSLFGVPNMDISNVKEMLPGDNPEVGGFFANGEIGPVGISGGSARISKPTHLHGFTTVVAVICEKVSAMKSSASASNDEFLDAWG